MKPTMMRANLRRFLRDDCAAEDFVEGGQLYTRYSRQIRDVADHYGFPFAAACGAFAALSPNSSIEGNLRSLVTCMLGVIDGWPENVIPIATYNRMRTPALKMLRGEAEFADLCRGPKIHAFRHNLIFPETSERITIDGHMIAIMLGRPLQMREAEQAKREILGGYDELERVFRTFARRHCQEGVPLCALQAVMWTARRRKAGREVKPWRHIPPSEIRPFPVGMAAE